MEGALGFFQNTISYSSSSSSSGFFIAIIFAVFFFCALAFKRPYKKGKGTEPFCHSCNGGVLAKEEEEEKEKEKGEVAVAASIMEQLVPEIRTHALSYLDYHSLCRLSMTNSSMRRAANDDNAWKSLYHKDFTTEQDGVTPSNGWKAYYAATKAVVDVNAEYYNILREKNVTAMSHLWYKADYVKCIHPRGLLLSGYDAVMENWELAFRWDQPLEYQTSDVRVRVVGNMAWVTSKEFLNAALEPFLTTNIYEFHNDRWFMVHHHSIRIPEDGAAVLGAFG